jgi:hypothetical protein
MLHDRGVTVGLLGPSESVCRRPTYEGVDYIITFNQVFIKGKVWHGIHIFHSKLILASMCLLC